MRHLPVSGLAHRRAAGFAMAVAQTPILLILAVLAVLVSPGPADLARHVLRIAITAMAAALWATPAVRRWLAAPLALMAAVAAGMGGWEALALGAVFLIAADLVAGPLARLGVPVHVSRRVGGGWIEPRIAWRALGWSFLGALALALLPVGAAWAFTAHNELAPEHARLAARLGGGISAVLFLASMGESLAVRRPAWPWSRSLPWSAAQRVRSDALFLGLHTLPLVLLAAAVHPAALAVVAILPFLTLRAAGAIRRAPERRTGASGEILAEGLILAALVALWPWTCLLALAGTPLALRFAAERERRQKVSRWLEIHHLAAGDPQSWSAS
jgi:hypothetical protein